MYVDQGSASSSDHNGDSTDPTAADAIRAKVAEEIAVAIQARIPATAEDVAAARVQGAWRDAAAIALEFAERRAGDRVPTSGGVELTDEIIEQLAVEAEAGYDIARIRPRGH